MKWNCLIRAYVCFLGQLILCASVEKLIAHHSATIKLQDQLSGMTESQKKTHMNQKDAYGHTPLYYFTGTEKDLEALLDYQPDASELLHKIAQNPQFITNEKFINYLVKNPATGRGHNVLHMAIFKTNVEQGNKPQLLKELRDVIEKKALINPPEKKALIRQQDASGRTPLHYFKGTEEDLEAFLDYQPDLSIEADDKHTIFHQLAQTPAFITNKKFIAYVKSTMKDRQLANLINSYGSRGRAVIHDFIKHPGPTPDQLMLFLDTYKPLLHVRSFGEFSDYNTLLYWVVGRKDEMGSLFGCIEAYAQKYKIDLKTALNVRCGAQSDDTVLKKLQRIETAISDEVERLKKGTDKASLGKAQNSLKDYQIWCKKVEQYGGTIEGVEPPKEVARDNNRAEGKPQERSVGREALSVSSCTDTNPVFKDENTSDEPHVTRRSSSTHSNKHDTNPTDDEKSFLKKHGVMKVGLGVAGAVSLAALVVYAFKKAFNRQQHDGNKETSEDYSKEIEQGLVPGQA